MPIPVFWLVRFLIHKLKRKSPFCLYLNLTLILDSFLPYPVFSVFTNPVTSTSKIHPESDISSHLFHSHPSSGLRITAVASSWISLCPLVPLKSTLHTATRVSFLKNSSDHITHMLKILQWFPWASTVRHHFQFPLCLPSCILVLFLCIKLNKLTSIPDPLYFVLLSPGMLFLHIVTCFFFPIIHLTAQKLPHRAFSWPL